MNNQIVPGDLVKISRGGEKFWVLIEYEHDEPGIYTARVDNYLINLIYKYGERMVITRDEILDLYKKDK